MSLIRFDAQGALNYDDAQLQRFFSDVSGITRLENKEDRLLQALKDPGTYLEARNKKVKAAKEAAEKEFAKIFKASVGISDESTAKVAAAQGAMGVFNSQLALINQEFPEEVANFTAGNIEKGHRLRFGSELGRPASYSMKPRRKRRSKKNK